MLTKLNKSLHNLLNFIDFFDISYVYSILGGLCLCACQANSWTSFGAKRT